MPAARLIVVVAVIAAGCGGTRSPKPAPAAAAPVAAGPPTLATARAYERGGGVARDYRKAAEIYDARCDGGAGDPAACRALIRAYSLSRGVDFDQARTFEIAARLCDVHDDVLGCTLWALSRDPHAIEVASAARVCDAEHVDACEAGYDMGELFVMGDQSSARQWAVRQYNDAGCKVGVIDSCTALVTELTSCAENSADPAQCTAAVAAEWDEDEQTDRLDALARLHAACDLGDADACAALPGREIPLRELCDAHDYAACGELGCQGDADAAAIAAAHHVDARC